MKNPNEKKQINCKISRTIFILAKCLRTQAGILIVQSRLYDKLCLNHNINNPTINEQMQIIKLIIVL